MILLQIAACGVIGAITRCAFQYVRGFGYPKTALHVLCEVIIGAFAAAIGMSILDFVGIPFPPEFPTWWWPRF